MIALRRLAPAQWRALREVRLAALADAPGNFFRSIEAETARPDADWRDLLARDDAAVFGAFDGEALVGITAVIADPADASGRTATLGMTWLAPAYRGRGVAHRFYAERLAWARARGFARVTVSHRASNAPSRRAMLAAGFVEVRREPHLWPDGVAEDDVCYAMTLS